MENQFSQYQDLEKIMITRDEIQTQVKEVAKRISADYQGKRLWLCAFSRAR